MSDQLMTLDEIRTRLDSGDTLMLEWLATRIDLVKEVARIKSRDDDPIHSPKREAEMFARMQRLCRVYGLDFDYVSEIISLMIWHSKQVEARELELPTFMKTEKIDREQCKKELIELTNKVVTRYDDNYCRGTGSETNSNYLDWERSHIQSTIDSLNTPRLAVDLGCATGNTSITLSKHFENVVGYDLSEAMIKWAKEKSKGTTNLSFEVCDLDHTFPVKPGSADLIVANFGAASELGSALLGKLEKALAPGGKAVLSYYNKDALSNHWFYPWPASVHSHLNQFNDSLEVWLGENVYTVPAEAHTRDSLRKLCSEYGFDMEECGTYPTLQPIPPNFLVSNQQPGEAFDICRDLDDHLQSPEIGRGMFILIVVSKPV